MRKTWFWIFYAITICIAFHMVGNVFSQKEVSVWMPEQNETYGFTIQVQNHLGEAVSGVSFYLYEYRESTVPLRYLNQSYIIPGEEVTAFLETTTRKNGILHFYGLKEGTYYLEEKGVPEGYRLLKERIAIHVDEYSSKSGIDYYIINGGLKKKSSL